MKRFIGIFVLFVFSMTAFANPDSVVVSVSESINGRMDNEVRQSARLKAKWKGLVALPILVAGEQRSHNGDFSEQIKAIGLEFVEVNAIREQWDRKNNVLVYEANVIADMERITNALQSIRSNMLASSRLKQLYQSLDAHLSKSLLTKATVNSINLLLTQVKLDPLIRRSAQETILLKNQLIEQLANKITTDLYEPFAENAQVNIVDVSFASIKVEIDFNGRKHPRRCLEERYRASCKMDEFLVSPILANFFYRHRESIRKRIGSPCLLKYAYLPSYGDALDPSATAENYHAQLPVMTDFESLAEQYSADKYENHVVKRVFVVKGISIVENQTNSLTFEYDRIDDVINDPGSFIELAICVYPVKNNHE